MGNFDLIVVGAGISGLSLAHEACERGRAVCVLERDSRVGGALHSARPGGDASSGGVAGDAFWLELGAHTAYNSYGRFLTLAESLGLAAGRTERATSKWRLWEDGRAVSVGSRLDWLQLALRLPRLLTAKRAGQTVEAYFSGALGSGNFARVVGPMLGAVVSQDAGGFPADALFKKRPRRKDWPRSFTLDGGLGSLPAALAAREGIAVHTDAAVESIGRDASRWRVETHDGGVFAADTLALAVPPDTAGSLLRDAAPEIAGTLAPLGVAEIATVGVVARKDRVTLPEMAGLVGLDAPFRSVVTRDTVPHESLRGFTFHFRPDAGETGQAEQIAGVLGCGPGQWEHRTSARRRIPTLTAGHRERIARLDALLAGQPLLLTGNWFGGMAIEDCLARSAEEAARLLD